MSQAGMTVVSSSPEAVSGFDSAANSADGHCRRHAVMLVVSSLALLLSCVLEVAPEGSVAVPGFESYPLPPACSVRLLFDSRCPGCGLTRGFIHLAHGRLTESLAVHRLAWLLFVVVLLQIPYRLIALVGDNPAPLGRRFPTICGFTLAALLLINWWTGLH